MTTATQTTIALPRYRRIVVVGSAGSGKTTLALAIAQRLGSTHVELDAIHWGPGWTEPPLELFRARAGRALEGAAWVADGNYSEVRDIVWSRADTIVWLDYALATCIWRLFWRTIRRAISGEELWGANRERLGSQFFSSESLLWYTLRTFRRRRREYARLLQQPEHAHLESVRLRSARAASRWLATL